INLKIIPENLFKYNTKTTTFNGSGANGGCFYKCTSLTNIPEGLFKYNTEVTSFNSVFRDCKNIIEIPEGLFKYNTKVTNFGITFYLCSGLTGESPYTIIQVDGVDTKVHLYERSKYPEHFTAPTSYSDCFYNCKKLTDYNSLPYNWN
ncbi:MAG: hypothetical protein J6R54_01590, partial [Bacteroidaceae bacterium]|nr:hypothetical protein [Bacteroidaceae bacterium]